MTSLFVQLGYFCISLEFCIEQQEGRLGGRDLILPCEPFEGNVLYIG